MRKVLIIISFLFLYAFQVQALSCVGSEYRFIVMCQSGACTEGFIIDSKGTGNYCDARQVVRDDQTFLTESINKYIGLPAEQRSIGDGIYELTFIWSVGERETQLTKISDEVTPSGLAEVRASWERIEQKEKRAVLWDVAVGAALRIGILALLVLWPLVLYRVWRSKRHRLPNWLRRAIIPQIIYVLSVSFIDSWSYSLWQTVDFFGRVIVLMFIAFEILRGIIYPIVKWFQSRNQKKQMSDPPKHEGES